MMGSLELIAWIGVLYMVLRGIDWGGGWVVPLADTATERTVISQEFRRPDHLGVDLMYRGAAGFVLPEGTHVLAARDATVWSTGSSDRGLNVVLDHGPPFATFYQHLSEVLVHKGDKVSAGQAIGVAGIDPTDRAQIRHLHFAVWFKGHGDSASVDPGPAMASWRRVISG